MTCSEPLTETSITSQTRRTKVDAFLALKRSAGGDVESQLKACRSEDVLELLGDGGAAAHGTDGPRLMPLCKDDSSLNKIKWVADRSDDCWDRDLLAAAKEAAAWLTEKGLQPWLDEGLQNLAAEGCQGTAATTPLQLSVALCTATKNRLWQLRHVLPLNLLHCWPHRSQVRLHLVDFDSSDGTLEFVLKYCRAAIDCDLLRVYSSSELPHWHASVAKNTAHVCATKEDVLVNLDGDNLVGPHFLQDVVQQFASGYKGAVQYEGDKGTCGRIACRRSDFLSLGGYDEDGYPMGAQDIDLVQRFRKLPGAGYRRVCGAACGTAIPNSKEQAIKCCDPEIYGGVKWHHMDAVNKQRFNERTKLGQFVRNQDKATLGVNVQRIFPQETQEEQEC